MSNESRRVDPPAAPIERDKALVQEVLQQVISEGLDEKYLLGVIATVRAEEQRNFVSNVAAVLDGDDVELFTALITRAKASPGLNSATRSALKSEIEIRAEEREATFRDAKDAMREPSAGTMSSVEFHKGFEAMRKLAVRAIESARAGKVE